MASSSTTSWPYSCRSAADIGPVEQVRRSARTRARGARAPPSRGPRSGSRGRTGRRSPAGRWLLTVGHRARLVSGHMSSTSVAVAGDAAARPSGDERVAASVEAAVDEVRAAATTGSPCATWPAGPASRRRPPTRTSRRRTTSSPRCSGAGCRPLARADRSIGRRCAARSGRGRAARHRPPRRRRARAGRRVDHRGPGPRPRRAARCATGSARRARPPRPRRSATTPTPPCSGARPGAVSGALLQAGDGLLPLRRAAPTAWHEVAGLLLGGDGR